MPPSLLAALVAAILAAAWILRRRAPVPSALAAGPAHAPTPGMASAVAALVAPSAPGVDDPPAPSATAVEAAAALANLAGLSPSRRGQALRRLAQGDPDQRLLAVQAAGRWGHRQALPLLRQALRDPQPEVVRAAVLALEPFRRGPAIGPLPKAPQPPRLPANAAPRFTARKR